VLKGPQGTLFGKNTTAGAVLLTTQTPTDEFGGYGNIRLGSYKRVETEGAINVPLTDNLDGRLSFRTQNADGYITHLLNNGRSGNLDNKSVRLQLREHTGALTIDLLGEYNESTTDGGATIPVKCEEDAFYIYNYDSLHKTPYCTAYPLLGKKYEVYGGATLTAPTSAIATDEAVGGDYNSGIARYAGQSPFNDTHVYTLNGRITYDLTDKISIHSVTAFRRSTAAFYEATDDVPNDIYAEYDNTKTNQFTQELNIGGTALDDRLSFVAGLYYFNQKTSFLQDTGPDWVDPLGYVYDSSLKYQSYAAYAQASYKITPKLELTAGVRYSKDHKSGSSYVFFTDNGSSFVQNGQTYYCNYNTPNPVVGYGGGANGAFTGDFIGGIGTCGGPAFTAVGKHNWSSVDPKAQLSYKWNDHIYTYVTASHGYNAGGFNMQLGAQPANGQFAPYNPEKLWSYEGGIKADLFDHRFIVNLSGFYQKYSRIQSTVLEIIGGIATRQLQSAASAHEAGMEAEFTIQPTRDLVIRGNASYLTQAYDKIYPGATVTLASQIDSAPKYTFSAAVAYTFHVGESGTLVPGFDVRGMGSKPSCEEGGGVFDCKLPPYAIVGVRLDYTPREDSRWTVAFYGTNVFNKYVELDHSNGEYSQFGIDSITPGRPQEFGVEAKYKF
jgi:iron complex outermembrane receptor protein